MSNLFVEFVKNNSRQFFEWDMEEKTFCVIILLRHMKEVYLKIIEKM